MTGVAGSTIGIAGVQPAIGAYVQDATHPNGETNYIGCNPATAHDTDVLGQWSATATFTCPTNEEAAAGGIGSWVKSASVLVPTDKVVIANGVATKDNATGTHTVFCKAAVGQYLWAVDIA